MKRAIGIALLIATLGAISVFSLRPAPPETVTVTTENLPELLPHFHGPSDKVDDPHHGVEVFSLPVNVPQDMWVTDVHISIQNAPQGVIHHMYVLKLHAGGPDDSLDHPLMIVGQDTTTEFHFPSPSGFYLPKGTQLGLDVLLHNAVPPEGEGGIYKDVTVSVTFTGVGNGQGRTAPLYFNLIRLTDDTTPDLIRGGNSEFTVPAATSTYVRTSAMNDPSITTGAYTFVADGWVVGMGGHMHAWEGGREVDAYINGKQVAAFHPHLVTPSKPWDWRTDVGPIYLHVHKGDVMSLSVTYTNPSDTPLQGEMGLLGFFYAPDTASEHTTQAEFLWPMKSALYPLLERIGIWPAS